MKEFKETTKKSTITLIIIIAILSTLFILSLTGEISLEPKEKVPAPNKTEERIYTYDEISGLYTKEEFITVDNEQIKERTDLLLNSDGTYFYSYAVRASQRNIGNYIINGNKIILNKLFEVSDGPGITPNFETITIEINQDKTISHTISKIVTGPNKEIKLTKNTDAAKEEFIRVYGADKDTLLKNSYYSNNKSILYKQ